MSGGLAGVGWACRGVNAAYYFMTEALNQPRLVDSLSGAALVGPEELKRMNKWS